VIQLTAWALAVDMTAALPAGDAAVKARANQSKSGKPGNHAPHVEASREISACSPRSIVAVV
jgi:hypothetical protein